MTAQMSLSDRFFRALFASLLSDDLRRSSKTSMFLALLLKALRGDSNEQRVVAFIRRMLQVCAHQPSNFSCGALVVIAQLCKERPKYPPPSDALTKKAARNV
jgi:ribosome biogenesis protein MAK21